MRKMWNLPRLRFTNVTATQMVQQADQLVSLAQQVRAETERATQGVLAKDLNSKLKRIEKLSKELRTCP